MHKNQIKNVLTPRLWLVTAMGAMLAGCATAPRTAPPMPDQTAGYVKAARADIRERKVAVIDAAMQLSPAEHDPFWHVYYQYEAELKKINDDKLALIRDYEFNYSQMDDRTADQLARTALKIQGRMLDLRGKYYGKMKDATSAITAARFLQVEHQINLLFDLEIASQLPLLTKK